MSAGEGKSGREVGAENVERLRAYLANVETLPSRAGKANLSAIAVGAGLDRQVLYKNPECSRLLDQALVEKGLEGVQARGEDDPDKLRLERRIMSLEQSKEALLAEVYDLRRKLLLLRHVEEMLEQGKRVIP